MNIRKNIKRLLGKKPVQRGGSTSTIIGDLPSPHILKALTLIPEAFNRPGQEITNEEAHTILDALIELPPDSHLGKAAHTADLSDPEAIGIDLLCVSERSAVANTLMELASLNDESVRNAVFNVFAQVIQHVEFEHPNAGNCFTVGAFIAWQTDRTDLCLEGLALARVVNADNIFVTGNPPLDVIARSPGSAENWRMYGVSS